MQLRAFLASIVLHLIIIIFSATYTGISRQTPIDLSREVHMVELVYMAEPEPPAPEVPEPRIPEPPRPEPAPKPPEPKVEIPEKPKPKPEPEPKPEPRPEPKTEPKPEPKPEPPKEKTPTPEERLARELAALRKDVEQSTADQAPREQAGLLEVYAVIAEEHIKRNWRFPRIGGAQNLVVRIEVQIDPTGRITSSRILRGSGREDFDHSALRAIEDTRQLPEPPSTRIRTLVIDFNLHDLS
jgi:colicin import membrane protein